MQYQRFNILLIPNYTDSKMPEGSLSFVCSCEVSRPVLWRVEKACEILLQEWRVFAFSISKYNESIEKVMSSFHLFYNRFLKHLHYTSKRYSLQREVSQKRSIFLMSVQTASICRNEGNKLFWKWYDRIIWKCNCNPFLIKVIDRHQISTTLCNL